MPHVTIIGDSSKYHEMLNLAKAKFRVALAGSEKFTLSHVQKIQGVDFLPKNLENMCAEVAKQIFQEQDYYEVSYNQLCRAFFDTVEDLGLVTYTGEALI